MRLVCDPIELAWRAVARHAGQAVRTRLEPRLQLPPGSSLADALREIAQHWEASVVAAQIDAIAGRDGRDFDRLERLYGARADDVTIDTSSMGLQRMVETIQATVGTRWTGRT